MHGPVPTRPRRRTVPGFSAFAARAALLVAAVLTLSSCGTVLTFAGGFEETDSALSPKPMGGVRLDVRGISTFAGEQFPWCLAVVAFAIDLPLSAAADVVTLPVTIPLHLSRPATAAPPSSPDPDATAAGSERPRSSRSSPAEGPPGQDSGRPPGGQAPAGPRPARSAAGSPPDGSPRPDVAPRKD